MLSPIDEVKLSNSIKQQDSDLHSHQAMSSHRGMSTVDSLVLNHHRRQSEMSRRKQKNPKPFFTSNEDQDDDKSNDLDGRSFSSSEDDEMAQIVDLSSLVKVEIREGYSQALSDATTQRSAGATSRSPTTPTSSPRHSISTPISPPPQFGIQGDLFPHLFGKDAPNMFHFGDVKVNHHLETQSTPMVIPMVYLYPILDENQDSHQMHYKMFVPVGVPVEGLPNLHSDFPDISVQRQEASSLVKKHPQRASDAPSCTAPLDLRKSQRNRASSTPHPEDDLDQHRNFPSFPQRFPKIEVQLQFLKDKQLEFLQTHNEQAVASLAMANMSRCDECNINFSKYQNYVAHKKYYCSGKSNLSTTPVQAVSENDDDDPLPDPAPKRLKVDTSGPSSPLPLSTTLSLANPSSSGLTSPVHDAQSKELKLEKPQNQLKEPSHPLLHSSDNPHFVCDGCGIKFKSVSNLQAHKARYCAGLRKSEELASFEVALGRSNQRKQSVSPQQMHIPLAIAEMVNLLNAKTLKKQLLVRAKQAQFSAFTKEKIPSSINAEKAGTSGNLQNGVQEDDDFCCILCGFKEQSHEKLKEHINLHFIGQVKHSPVATSPSDKSPRTASNGSSPTIGITIDDPIKRESKAGKTDSIELEDKASDLSHRASPKPGSSATAPSTVSSKTERALQCNSCDIGFSHLSNLVAHKKFYCRGLQPIASRDDR